MSKNVIITGASHGLGAAIKKELDPLIEFNVWNYDIEDGHDVLTPDLSDFPDTLDILVNCAGINKINWLEDVTEDEWNRVMDVNVKGPFLMAQKCAPLLRASGGTILNIVSNASHVPMRCSAAYNASKGALSILTKQLARELAPEVTVFGISPNKLSDTEMSRDIDEQVVATRGWTHEEAREYQLKGLLTGEETPVGQLAEFVGFLLSRKNRHKYLTGCDIPYGA